MHWLCACSLAVIAAIALPGCGESDSSSASANANPVGTWKMDVASTKAAMQARLKAEQDNGKMTEAEAGMMANMLDAMLAQMDITIQFKADGTVAATASLPGETKADTKTGTWTAKGNELNIKLEGQGAEGSTGRIAGDLLILVKDKDSPPITFKRS